MMKMLWSEKVAAATKPPDISMKEGPGSLRRKSAGKSSVHAQNISKLMLTENHGKNSLN